MKDLSDCAVLHLLASLLLGLAQRWNANHQTRIPENVGAATTGELRGSRYSTADEFDREETRVVSIEVEIGIVSRLCQLHIARGSEEEKCSLLLPAKTTIDSESWDFHFDWSTGS